MSSESKKPENPRSPGVTDRDAIVPEQTDNQGEVVRKLITPEDVTDASAKSDETRSPGVTDRDAIVLEQPDNQGEVIRKPIAPDATDSSAKSEGTRSPGVTDRDISAEEITTSTTEETETVRRLIMPDGIEE
ncbi:MAG: hypothetical protein WA919_03290 [Coleofasciculaceae cyanobacterium]